MAVWQDMKNFLPERQWLMIYFILRLHCTMKISSIYLPLSHSKYGVFVFNTTTKGDTKFFGV